MASYKRNCHAFHAIDEAYFMVTATCLNAEYEY